MAPPSSLSHSASYSRAKKSVLGTHGKTMRRICLSCSHLSSCFSFEVRDVPPLFAFYRGDGLVPLRRLSPRFHPRGRHPHPHPPSHPPPHPILIPCLPRSPHAAVSRVRDPARAHPIARSSARSPPAHAHQAAPGRRTHHLIHLAPPDVSRMCWDFYTRYV